VIINISHSISNSRQNLQSSARFEHVAIVRLVSTSIRRPFDDHSTAY